MLWTYGTKGLELDCVQQGSKVERKVSMRVNTSTNPRQ